MRKCVFIAIMLVSCLLPACSKTAEADELTKVAAQVEQILPSEAIKQYETETYHLFSAKDAGGNPFEYYLCITTYCAADPETAPKLHTDAFSAVFDLGNAVLIRELDICGHAAAIYQETDQNYLCCTLSPATSVVLEYAPDTLSEDDAVHILRSIYDPADA